MDNTIIPYEDASSGSSSDLDDSSSDDEHSHLLSNNIGVHYNNFISSYGRTKIIFIRVHITYLK